MKRFLKIIYICIKTRRTDKISFFKSIFYTLFCKKTNSSGLIIISKKSKIILHKKSKIIVNGMLSVLHSYIDVVLDSIIIIGANSTWKIDGNVKVCGSCINLWDDAYLETKDMRINAMTKINIQKKATFGNNILIARCCYITDTNSHDIIASSQPIPKQKEITFKDNVWIGSNCNILRGASIGKNVVVGANTTISGVVENNVLIRNSNFKVKKRIDGFVA